MPEIAGEGLEVLDDGREVKLVACTREAPQAHSLEAVMGLEVRKAHLDPFALVTRFVELRRAHQRSCLIAGILVYVTRDFSEGHISSNAAVQVSEIGGRPSRRSVSRLPATSIG
jgi:hypothetical protein